MERSIFVLTCLYAIVAVLTIERLEIRWIVAACVFAAAIAFFPHGVIRRTFIPMITEKYRAAAEQVIAIRESPSETDTYLRRDLAGEPYSYRLMTNGISMLGMPFVNIVARYGPSGRLPRVPDQLVSLRSEFGATIKVCSLSTRSSWTSG